jgi:undecaprenyl-diphosphatase
MQDVLIKLIADGAVVPIVLIGAWALLFRLRPGSKYAAYCRILMAGLTAYLFAKLAGSVYQPEMQRPFEILGVQAGASFLNNPGFPSDHVLFCTTITLAVWFETHSKKITVALSVLTVLVATGRVLALVHSPLDVAGGAMIAMIGALWYLQRQETPSLRVTKHWSKPVKAGKIS